jgi:uncharacterized lipoprotein YmbA
MTRVVGWVVALAYLLPGCVSSPEQSVYVLSVPARFQPGPPVSSAGLVLQVRPVILPDYLDTTDMMTRSAQYGVKASRTGRWGERLSEGVTQALRVDLGQLLPAYVVTDGPTETPALRLEVAVDAFDVTQVSSVLTASWSITTADDTRARFISHGTFISSLGGTGGDPAMVTAMAETIAKLADAVAATTSGGVAGRSSMVLHN